MVKYLAKQGKEPMFCNRKCSDAHQSTQITYHDFECLCCGETFTKTGREVRNAERNGQEIKFCSRKCKSDYWGKNRVEVECPVCGEKFLQQNRLKDNSLTCSPECAKARSESYYTTRICEHCGEEYKVEKSYIASQEARGQRIKFCSKECFTEHTRVDIVEITCDHCQKTFQKNKNYIGDHNFCSIDCKKEYHKENDRADIVCQQCGNTFSATKYQIDHGRKFCSMDCWNNNRATDKDSYAQIAHYLRSTKEYDDWRLSVLSQSDFKCSECGQKGVLQAHHLYPLYKICKDYNYTIDKVMKSDVFNDATNGKCLCVDCHRSKHPQLQRNNKGQFCRPEISLQKSLDD